MAKPTKQSKATQEKASGSTAEQQVINGVMKVNQAISNLMYQEPVFKAMLSDIDQGGDRITVIGDITLHILDRFRSNYKNLPDYLLLSAGVIIIQNIADDLKNTGRKPIDDQEMPALVNYAMKKFMQMHQHELDMVSIGQQLKQLQYAFANGEMAQKIAPKMKMSAQQVNQVLAGGKPEQVMQSGLLGVAR